MGELVQAGGVQPPAVPASAPTGTLAEEALQNLLPGAGYGAYRKANAMRADDLLVRQRASGNLTSANDTVRRAIDAWRKNAIPPSTRENPFPPAEAMATLRAFNELGKSIAEVENAIRSAPTPTSDRVWDRFRSEASLLQTLLVADYNLMQSTQAVREAAEAVSDLGAGISVYETVRERLDDVRRSLRTRTDMLTLL